MKKNFRRICAVALCLALVMVMPMTASAVSFTFDEGDGVKTMTVTATGSVSRVITVSSVPAMDHYEGISETMASMSGFSVTAYANYVKSPSYNSYVIQAMKETGMLQSYTHTEPGPFYYTFDTLTPSGLYQLKVTFSGKYGNWRLTEGTSANGTVLDTCTISYAPNGDSSWFVDKIGY